MKYYEIEPEVAGGFGENTKIIHRQGKPFVVVRLHYEFEGWLGDELLESTPCFIVSKALASEMERARLTGFSFDVVEVTVSREFTEMQSDVNLPEFMWLKIDGRPGIDDLGLSSELRLIVSDRALRLISSKISHAASIKPYPSEGMRD